MGTPETPMPEKKKLPGWVKLIIVLAILVVGLSVVASIGMSFLAGLVTSRNGEKIAQKGVEKLIERGLEQAGGGKANVDITEKGIIVRDEQGEEQLALRAGQRLPAGFPGDIPIYSQSQVQGSMVMGPMTMVTLESSSALPEVSSFYQRELGPKGWTQVFSASPSPESFSGIFRKENRQLTVTLAAEREKTSIVLTYGLDQIQP